MSAKTHQFKAETYKVLNILTNSLYTNREIFLRELLSNASDALDKLRFLRSKGDEPIFPELPLEIRIDADKDNGVLTVRDTGIGMTAAEMEENLGTIAKSGSEQFLKDIKAESAFSDEQTAESEAGKPEEADSTGEDAGNDGEEEIIERDDTAQLDASQIIGRFGVGFYSVFMVADTVEVYSVPALPKADDPESQKGHVWSSSGTGTFTISDLSPEMIEELKLQRGTVIKANLKSNAKEFLEKFRLESVIRGHSNFLPFPIYLNGEQVNTTPALWREPKFSITREQYNDFYKFLTYDSEPPMDVIHLAVDAPVQFNALMFIPEKSSDYFNEQKDEWGLDLYVRRVLIERSRKELIPNYLAFLKGVVDTEDLPLNISRETLQENEILQKITRTIVRQVFSHMEKMAKNDVGLYEKFWKEHGRYFKFAFNDYAYRDRVAPLLRFQTSATEGDGIIGLDDYLERAKAGQKEIWYVSGGSREAAQLNPHLARFRRKGIEVLFLYDAVDELALESLGTYSGHAFKSIEKAGAADLKDFEDVEEKKDVLPDLDEADKSDFDAMLPFIKEKIGEKVTEVRVSDRLEDSPACLVAPDGMSASMEKLMRAMNRDDSVPSRAMEVNPNHAILRAMLKLYKADKESPVLADMIKALYESTLLLDGYLPDPYGYARTTLSLLEKLGEKGNA
ncbi:MAG: molecular chaperone HtpG [Mailhella sp.]|nr:molecular chaperone HtpG [Mailhella sp.]